MEKVSAKKLIDLLKSFDGSPKKIEFIARELWGEGTNGMMPRFFRKKVSGRLRKLFFQGQVCRNEDGYYFAEKLLTIFEHWHRYRPVYGSFLTNLLKAYEVADSENTNKLNQAFSYLFVDKKLRNKPF